MTATHPIISPRVRRLSQIIALVVTLGATGLVPALGHAIAGDSDDCGTERDSPHPADAAEAYEGTDEGEQNSQGDGAEQPCRDCNAADCGICLFCSARVIPAAAAPPAPLRAMASPAPPPLASPVCSFDGDGIFHIPKA
jgi:hypothetical protein